MVKYELCFGFQKEFTGYNRNKVKFDPGIECHHQIHILAMFISNGSATTTMIGSGGSIGPITWDDATWILTSAFIIFTMQSGFGLLEAGCVSGKNEVNIMVKNAIDVVFGGLSYWAFGFGLSFGEDVGTNPFCGVGYFLVDSSDENMGILYSTFVFQLSFATTATTIVSGAMAERTKLTAYILFSFFNTVIYCFPAHWEWAQNGFLRTLGCVDVAGSGAVHLVGGVSGLVAAIMWGWLAFNCGSTFGISGGKWKLAAKSAVTTLNGSMGGGAAGIILSFIVNRRKYDVSFIINSVLGALVSITGACAVIRPWEAIIIGAFGGLLSLGTIKLLNKLRIDDPVGAVGVHGACGVWGLLSVGLFADFDPFENTTQGRRGLFHGGGFYLFGIQLLAAVVIAIWSSLMTVLILSIIKTLVGLRMSLEDELKGADFAEHGIKDENSEITIFQQNNNREDVEQPKSLRDSPIKTISLPGSVQNEDKTLVANGNRRGSILTRKFSSNRLRPLTVQPSKENMTNDIKL
ncbi:hypothetical protein KUTeg_018205 [Tegillarca granosa]|uniref:Ammonium transporter AmtB-like domain-containing protein n=1 Tax=Tegillarca granosa TaxID=220873 RepID=A0ABQ9EL23_TEGGR|nr:hypothetical protein KUTeg_018205 [Tegillarca granosa]